MKPWMIGGLALALCAAGAASAQECPANIRLLGEATLPHRMDYQGTVVGGLSGLAFDPGAGTFLALSDDRSELGPARFYHLKVDVGAGGLGLVQIVGVTTLKQPDGSPYPPKAVDPEAIAVLAGGNQLLWSTEAHPADKADVALIVADREGKELRRLPLPARYLNDATGNRGSHDNLGLEGIAVMPDDKTLAIAFENALIQDGPVAGLQSESPTRIALIDLATGAVKREVIYMVGRIPEAPPAGTSGRPDNGISEILAFDESTLLVQERAFIPGRGNVIRVYRVVLPLATDVKGFDSLQRQGIVAATKSLFLDFACLNTKLDNFEALAWGPILPNGNRTLIAVSDDNFSQRQVTKFLLIEVGK